MFQLLLGKLFRLTYKQISVVFNLWVRGVVLTLSGLTPFRASICLLTEDVSIDRLLQALLLFCYGMVYVYAFIKILRHYHLPFDDAFDRCVSDLQWLARKWSTTYQIVNLLIFVVLFLLISSINILGGYLLLKK